MSSKKRICQRKKEVSGSSKISICQRKKEVSGIDSTAVSIFVDILVEFVNSINITTYIEKAALSSQGQHR